MIQVTGILYLQLVRPWQAEELAQSALLPPEVTPPEDQLPITDREWNASNRS